MLVVGGLQAGHRRRPRMPSLDIMEILERDGARISRTTLRAGGPAQRRHASRQGAHAGLDPFRRLRRHRDGAQERRLRDDREARAHDRRLPQRAPGTPHARRLQAVGRPVARYLVTGGRIHRLPHRRAPAPGRARRANPRQSRHGEARERGRDPAGGPRTPRVARGRRSRRGRLPAGLRGRRLRLSRGRARLGAALGGAARGDDEPSTCSEPCTSFRRPGRRAYGASSGPRPRRSTGTPHAAQARGDAPVAALALRGGESSRARSSRASSPRRWISRPCRFATSTSSARGRIPTRSTAVIPRFIRALVEGRRPTVYGDGEQSRDFTYVDNVVQANLAACEGGPGRGEAVTSPAASATP